MTYSPSKISDFTANNVSLKATGIAGTAVAGQVTDIDYQMPNDRIIIGGHFIAKNHVFGDTVTLQVVDKDNILGYGANLVLREFATNWGLSDDTQFQHGLEQIGIPAKVLQNLYLRFKYTSTGNANVSLVFNIYMYDIVP